MSDRVDTTLVRLGAAIEAGLAVGWAYLFIVAADFFNSEAPQAELGICTNFSQRRDIIEILRKMADHLEKQDDSVPLTSVEDLRKRRR